MSSPVQARAGLLTSAAMLVVLTASAASAQTVWSNRDIGRPAPGSTGVTGSASLEIAAAGTGALGTSDQLHFTYQHFYGDADIAIRIDSATKFDADMQVGIMFRSVLGGGAKNVALLYSPLTGVVLQARYVAGRRTQRTALGPGRLPMWLRLAREGDAFNAYRSSDGTSWERIGRLKASMKTEIYAGLAAASGRERLLAHFAFSSVKVEAHPPVLPDPWTRTDIGEATGDGFSWTESSAFVADSTGRGFDNGLEEFHFVYQPFAGDMTIEGRAASLKSASKDAIAGLMIRRDLDPSSPYVLVARTAAAIWRTKTRGDAPGSEVEAAGPAGLPGWFRMVRTGALVQVYFSPDRTNWTEIASQELGLGETAYVGMALASGDPAAVARGVFRGVLVHPGPPPVNAPPIVEILTPWTGAQYGLGATVSVRANASDSDGTVRRVEFYADGALVGAADRAPFVASFKGPSAPGTVKLTAVAFDKKGVAGTSEEVDVSFADLDDPGEVALAFTASVDNSWVHHYTVAFYLTGADEGTAVPVSITDIGKPVATAEGEMVVDIRSLVTALPAGSYYAVVSAVASGAVGTSTASAEFSR